MSNIKAIIGLCEKLEFEVIETNNLPDRVRGRTVYTQQKILLNKRNKGRIKTLTLIHEAGHALHYLRSKEFVDTNYVEHWKEVRAYFYGWAIIKKYNYRVSKKAWAKFNQISFLERWYFTRLTRPTNQGK